MTFEKVILELGGNSTTRMPKTIELAQAMPEAFVLISSEGEPSYCLSALKTGGIDPDRFYLDFTAWDTVTNFTCTIRRIQSLGCKELYIVTDGFHMLRALSVATAVYFKTGIKLRPKPATPRDHHEAFTLVLFDSLRAWFWRFTNQILSDQTVYNDRVGGLQNDYYTARQLQQGQ
jgi:uncharacterized SAM-binding protein YcdF (DUF218 family)